MNVCIALDGSHAPVAAIITNKNLPQELVRSTYMPYDYFLQYAPAALAARPVQRAFQRAGVEPFNPRLVLSYCGDVEGKRSEELQETHKQRMAAPPGVNVPIVSTTTPPTATAVAASASHTRGPSILQGMLNSPQGIAEARKKKAVMTASATAKQRKQFKRPRTEVAARTQHNSTTQASPAMPLPTLGWPMYPCDPRQVQCAPSFGVPTYPTATGCGSAMTYGWRT